MRKIRTKIFELMALDPIKNKEMEYLNGSVDRYDLEFRQREIDRGLFKERRIY